MTGFFERHPLNVLLAHGGGTLPWILPRLDRVWSRAPGLRDQLPIAPSRIAKRFSYDTLVYDAANLQLLAQRVGFDRLVIGTDYPFVIAEDPPGEVARTCGFSETELDAILRENARLLLRLP
jgi:aminocarboxymuconate-semialdehyde decarboxylase